MKPKFLQPNAQALVETAFALPILVLLFMGCMQLIQIGLAHIVVKQAVYEAGRQHWIHQGQGPYAQRTAQEICRTLGPGQTEFHYQSNQYCVTYSLPSFFPLLKNIKIKHCCPDYLFRTEANE